MTADPMPFEDARAANRMLSRLFGTKHDDLHVVLFRLNPTRSISFKDIGAAAGDAAGESDVYVHVGLSRRPFKGGDRPTAAEIDALGGLWADVDIAHPVHKKAGLPPDQDAALAIIRAMGLLPGLVLHSGHGLQAHWPLSEVWDLDSIAERRKARVLARAWALTIKERARALGYTVDMVSDLARVMRVPGTVNAKDPDDIRPVLILSEQKTAISIDDVEAVLLDGTWQQAEREIDGKGSTDTISYGDLTLDPKAEPPWGKLDALREVEPRADQAWRRKRTKRTETWSSSEWDESLAAYAAQAGWSRQEIADLIIASRARHNDDLKLRQDYFRMTIDKAMAGQINVQAVREAVAASIDLAAAPPDERPDAERVDMLARLSAAIGVEITRITRSKSDPPSFWIETPYGSGTLGGSETLLSNRKFQTRLMDITARVANRLKDEAWLPLVQAMLVVSEVEDLGVESTLVGKAETLVSLYLGNQFAAPLNEMSDKAIEGLPIRLDPFIGDDGDVRLFASGFRAWLSEYQHEDLTRPEIGTMLRSIGAVSETKNFRVSGRRTSRSLWRIPGKDATAVQGVPT